jgi:hypothetical protein
MSLKNIMPKKKMQNGGTFLGPFATQAGQATPRQQFTPGFVPTRTGDTSPTIGLPGQDPIDSQSRRGDFIEKDTLNVPTAPSFTQPSGVLPSMSSAGGAPSGIPTPITQTGALPTSPGGQFRAFTTPTTDPFAADRAQMRTTVAATNAGIVGSELFSGDPTYAGGAKTGSDGLYATGGSGAFTSMAHYSSGVSQLDESNIVAEGINSGSFTNAQEGRSFISNAVESGFTQAEVETLAKNPTVTTNISMSQAPTPEAPDAPKVICAELYRQGLLEKEIFELDEEFGRHLRKVDPDIINGYHQWALPLVSLMQRSIVASHIIKIIARPVVKHIAYQMGYPSKTYLGHAMFTVGKHICKFIAKKDVAHA